jgi:catalase
LIATASISAFAYSAGWIGARTTSKTLIGNPAPDFPPGYRRAHGKGVCYAGVFRPNAAAQSLSKARVFSQDSVPVIGRFSIGSGNPHAADTSTKTVSMALLLDTDDGQQWRIAMNNQPYFATRNPEGFLAMRTATARDPATGRPDPARLAAFLKEYPEAAKFLAWSSKAIATSSFAGVTYHSINAFLLIAPDGKQQPVRWFMRPHDAFTPLANEQASKAGHDFLSDDLQQRLAQQALRWDLVFQLAQADDPVDDPSQPWPDSRKQVVAGTLEVIRATPQADGACRDINYDPTIVPTGIATSNDPVLDARSGAYAHSYNLRQREIGYGHASDAAAKGGAR